MRFWQRMFIRHPQLRAVMSVLLSIAMVLNSTPIRTYAEEVNEPQQVVEQSDSAEVTQDVADEQEAAADDEASDQGDQAEGIAAPADSMQLTTQADGDNVYTLQFFDRTGNQESAMPEDVKEMNPHLFAYLEGEDGEILGWCCTPFDQTACVATLPDGFSDNAYNATTNVAYDPAIHTLKARVIRGYHTGGEFFDIDWGNGKWIGIRSWNEYDSFSGFKFVDDAPEANVIKMQRDWNKRLAVELKYVNGDSGRSEAATVIVRAKATTTGWHYAKLPVSTISWNDEPVSFAIDEWFKKDGSSFGNDYSKAWQNVEACVFAGDVSLTDAASQLEDGAEGLPFLAGYLISSGEREIRDGSIDYDTNVQTTTLPVTLDGTPLDPALTPEKILGDAHEYGIVADTYNQAGHTETNFAVHHFNITGGNPT